MSHQSQLSLFTETESATRKLLESYSKKTLSSSNGLRSTSLQAQQITYPVSNHLITSKDRSQVPRNGQSRMWHPREDSNLRPTA